MAIKLKKRTIDRGWDDILAAIIALPGSEVSIGVLGKAGQDIVNRATFNEFGTRTIPERSFIRSTFDENLKKYENLTRREARKIGVQSTAAFLKRLGLRAEADIKRKIVKLKTPPNAPATIAAKGSSNPLIDTGRMRQSISHEIQQ